MKPYATGDCLFPLHLMREFWMSPGYLMDLLPAVLVAVAQLGVIVQQQLATVWISPNHGTMIEGSKPTTVLIVWRRPQIQQCLRIAHEIWRTYVHRLPTACDELYKDESFFGLCVWEGKCINSQSMLHGCAFGPLCAAPSGRLWFWSPDGLLRSSTP